MSDMAGSAASTQDAPDTAVQIPFGGQTTAPAPRPSTAVHPSEAVPTTPPVVHEDDEPAPLLFSEPGEPDPDPEAVPANPVLLDEYADDSTGKSWAAQVGLTFEEPSPKKINNERGIGKAFGWEARLLPITQHPNQWVKMSFIGKPRTAEHTCSALKRRVKLGNLPGQDTGTWEFTTRKDKEMDSSYLYVRYVPSQDAVATTGADNPDPFPGDTSNGGPVTAEDVEQALGVTTAFGADPNADVLS